MEMTIIVGSMTHTTTPTILWMPATTLMSLVMILLTMDLITIALNMEDVTTMLTTLLRRSHRQLIRRMHRKLVQWKSLRVSPRSKVKEKVKHLLRMRNKNLKECQRVNLKHQPLQVRLPRSMLLLHHANPSQNRLIMPMMLTLPMLSMLRLDQREER